MATGFVDITNLTSVYKADPNMILRATLVEVDNQTKDAFSFKTGVKYQDKVPYAYAVAMDLSTGDNTGFQYGSGGTSWKDVVITNTPLSFRHSYKAPVVQTTVLGLLQKGSDPASLPAKEFILQLTQSGLSYDSEVAIWQADTSTTVQTAGTTLNKFDGVIAQLRGVAGGYANAKLDYTAASDASILDDIKAIRNKMLSAKPALAQGKINTVLAMSPANFQKYIDARFNLAGTVTTLTIGADGKPITETFFPGQPNAKIIGLEGLSGKNEKILTKKENIIVAYDLVSDNEGVRLHYSEDARMHFLDGDFKLGVKVADPSDCIVSV
jgi:hypothetical protein